MILRKLSWAILLIVTLGSCSNAAEKNENKQATTRKGAQQGMKTYYLGHRPTGRVQVGGAEPEISVCRNKRD